MRHPGCITNVCGKCAVIIVVDLIAVVCESNNIDIMVVFIVASGCTANDIVSFVALRQRWRLFRNQEIALLIEGSCDKLINGNLMAIDGGRFTLALLAIWMLRFVFAIRTKMNCRFC